MCDLRWRDILHDPILSRPAHYCTILILYTPLVKHNQQPMHDLECFTGPYNKKEKSKSTVTNKQHKLFLVCLVALVLICGIIQTEKQISINQFIKEFCLLFRIAGVIKNLYD